MIGRYAPSPTGPLHLGNAFTAFVAHQRADERFYLRIEDLDVQRTIKGMAEQHIDDLRWLGLRWHEPPLYQSQRFALYADAVDGLVKKGLAYYCTCSRKTLAMSAPHGPQDDPPPYPGTCRGRTEKPEGRFSVRFLVRPGVVSFTDALRGPYSQDVAAAVGDFVISRADGNFAYQLAVVVDDIATGITEVVRGGDLLTSTPRQLLLYEAFNARAPAFAHTPLIVDSGGKLSKREPRHLMRAYAPELLRERFAKFAEARDEVLSLAQLGF